MADGPSTLAELAPAPYNPRTITDWAAGVLRDSMERFGDLSGLVFNRRSGNLIGGHQRIRHLPGDAEITIRKRFDPPNEKGTVALGYVEVDGERWIYREVDVDRDTERAMNLAANKHGGDWDPPKLGAVLTELVGAEFDMGLTGFSGAELDDLLALGSPGEAPEDPGPDVTRGEELAEKWGVVPGQIWTIPSQSIGEGAHRLMCGDATDPDALAELMGRDRAAMVWTDPPYGVGYVGKTKEALTIEGDDSDGTAALLDSAFAAVSRVVVPNAPFYIASPPGPQGTAFRLAVQRAGWRLHQVLVWVKSVMVLGHSDYHYRHEDILYGWTPGGGRPGRGAHEGSRWYGDHSQTTVFAVDKPARNADHPTEKPVDLIEPMIRNSARVGEIVLDVFSGSGSTIVSAERTARLARAVELEPAYVAVTLERMAGMGVEPRLTEG